MCKMLKIFLYSYLGFFGVEYVFIVKFCRLDIFRIIFLILYIIVFVFKKRDIGNKVEIYNFFWFI